MVQRTNIGQVAGPNRFRNHVRVFRFRLCHFGDGPEEMALGEGSSSRLFRPIWSREGFGGDQEGAARDSGVHAVFLDKAAYRERANHSIGVDTADPLPLGLGDGLAIGHDGKAPPVRPD